MLSASQHALLTVSVRLVQLSAAVCRAVRFGMDWSGLADDGGAAAAAAVAAVGKKGRRVESAKSRGNEHSIFECISLGRIAN